jgi:hypothetical protein
VAATEALSRRYGDKITFITIYAIEAHPTGSVSPYSDKEWTSSCSNDRLGNPITQPPTYRERIIQANKMVAELNITVPVLIDEFDNPLWCTYGPAPNIAYFIDRDGTVLVKQPWYDPPAMEDAIKKYLTDKQ